MCGGDEVPGRMQWWVWCGALLGLRVMTRVRTGLYLGCVKGMWELRRSSWCDTKTLALCGAAAAAVLFSWVTVGKSV